MTLKQAFTQWAAAPRNTVLAAKSRQAVQRVLMRQYGDLHLEVFTEAFCRRLFSECREIQELKVKAASVLVYVLQWGGDHGHCQRPKFTYEIATEEHRKCQSQTEQPADKPAEPKPASGQNRDKIGPKPDSCDGCNNVKGCINCTDGSERAVITEPKPTSNETSSETTMEQQTTKKKTRSKAPRPVVQIDPATLEAVKEWPSMAEAADAVGSLPSNIHRAVTQLRTAAGYYWCDPENAPQFADTMDRKKTITATRRAIAATINKGRRKQVGDAKAEKAKAEKQEQPLAAFTDRDLCDELRRRGWSITLTMAAD